MNDELRRALDDLRFSDDEKARLARNLAAACEEPERSGKRAFAASAQPGGKRTRRTIVAVAAAACLTAAICGGAYASGALSSMEDVFDDVFGGTSCANRGDRQDRASDWRKRHDERHYHHGRGDRRGCAQLRASVSRREGRRHGVRRHRASRKRSAAALVRKRLHAACTGLYGKRRQLQLPRSRSRRQRPSIRAANDREHLRRHHRGPRRRTSS